MDAVDEGGSMACPSGGAASGSCRWDCTTTRHAASGSAASASFDGNDGGDRAAMLMACFGGLWRSRSVLCLPLGPIHTITHDGCIIERPPGSDTPIWA